MVDLLNDGENELHECFYPGSDDDLDFEDVELVGEDTMYGSVYSLINILVITYLAKTLVKMITATPVQKTLISRVNQMMWYVHICIHTTLFFVYKNAYLYVCGCVCACACVCACVWLCVWVCAIKWGYDEHDMVHDIIIHVHNIACMHADMSSIVLAF